jgi:DNA polymerase-3 subunit delta
MPPAANVIFLYGNDEYAISRRLKEFESMFAGASELEMNMTRLEAATMTDEDLNNAVQALPFMAAQRLVLLANPSKRFVSARARNHAPVQTQAAKREETPEQGDAPLPGERVEAREKFLEFLRHVPPTTRLVITEVMDLSTKRDEEAADKHWLLKWMRQAGLGLERFALPAPAGMESWIAKTARAQGGVIDAAGSKRLAEMVGTDTRQAAQELTKLLTYVNGSRPITAADVDLLSPLTAHPDVFVMVDALADGKAGEAQRLLHRFLETGDSMSTWGMIIRQFRLVLLAREVIDSGGGESQAVQALGVHPFVAGKALKQARRFSLPALEHIYHRLLEVDEAAKTGRMPLELGIDLLVVELAG